MKHKFANLILILLSTCLVMLTACGCFCIYDAESASKMIHKTVRVITDSMLGAGMVYEIEEENVLIVTADHVTKGVNTCHIKFYDNTECEGTIVERDSLSDLALIEVDEALIAKETLSRLYSKEDFKKDEAKLPKDFWCVVPDGLKSGNTLIKGTIESEEEYFYELDATLIMGRMEAYEGYSGSPMFDKHGMIIGMITAGSPEGIVAGIGMDEISNWCAKVKSK